MLEQAQDACEAGGGSNSSGNGGGSSMVVRTPASMVPASALPEKPQESEKKKTPKDPKAIWDEDEVALGGDGLVTRNECGRKRPTYDIVYKQHVGAEDVYLGMGDVDPSSSSCDGMVVKIVLPGQQFQELDLDVKEHSVEVTSPEYRLATYLPHKVDHKSGKAKWDPKASTLSITLPIIRDDW